VLRCARWLFALSQVQMVCCIDLRYFVPQPCDALLDGLLHEDRLAEVASSRRPLLVGLPRTFRMHHPVCQTFLAHHDGLEAIPRASKGS